MYKYINVSQRTALTVTAIRKQKRRGIVIHETIGRDSLAWLQGGSALDGRPASADFLIRRDGDILQITRPGWYAYHTGVARWQLMQESDRTLNQSFVGIELENLPSAGDVITTEQYIACAALMARLVAVHELDMRNIVGHYQIALPAGRKSDPTTLNWSLLTREFNMPSFEQATIKFPEELP